MASKIPARVAVGAFPVRVMPVAWSVIPDTAQLVRGADGAVKPQSVTFSVLASGEATDISTAGLSLSVRYCMVSDDGLATITERVIRHSPARVTAPSSVQFDMIDVRLIDGDTVLAVAAVPVMAERRPDVKVTVSPESAVVTQGLRGMQVKYHVEVYSDGVRIAPSEYQLNQPKLNEQKYGYLHPDFGTGADMVKWTLFKESVKDSEGNPVDTGGYLLSYYGQTEADFSVPLTVTYDGTEYPIRIAMRSQMAPWHSEALMWDDYPADHTFADGTEGNGRIDLCFDYISESDHSSLAIYQCRRKHTKSAEHRPMRDTNGSHWTQLVQTNLGYFATLIAQRAQVADLAVGRLRKRHVTIDNSNYRDFVSVENTDSFTGNVLDFAKTGSWFTLSLTAPEQFMLRLPQDISYLGATVVMRSIPVQGVGITPSTVYVSGRFVNADHTDGSTFDANDGITRIFECRHQLLPNGNIDVYWVMTEGKYNI